MSHKVAIYPETSEGKKEVYYKCYFKIVRDILAMRKSIYI